MFKELAPYLRQRAVLLTVTRLEEDQIRVNVIPQKLKDGENAALTTPLTVTGTAEELDRDLPATLVGFVASHLQLKNTLDRAQSEIGRRRQGRAGRGPQQEQGNGDEGRPEARGSETCEDPETSGSRST
jgi:PRTRC genetic system protein E